MNFFPEHIQSVFKNSCSEIDFSQAITVQLPELVEGCHWFRQAQPTGL